MEVTVLPKSLKRRVLRSEQDEINGYAFYGFLAKRERKKHPKNADILLKMSHDEHDHYHRWASLTREEKRPRVFWMKVVSFVLGFTFVIKSMQKAEKYGVAEYESLAKEVPAAATMLTDEHRHERTLYALLDEERLHYVGATVLGLNDALVELTGAITGVTFSLQDCRLIALTGIVTGIAATLSMMASNYLAESAEGHKDALKSSFYTGVAYLVTVILLVSPYLFFMSDTKYGYLWAFCIMITIVIAEIAFFNFYLSVAQEKPFWKHFLLMAAISIGVSVLSFGIGILAKFLLGVNV